MWKPVETGFYVPRNPIGIININGNLQGYTLQSMMQTLAGVVRLYSVGTPQDLLQTLSHPDDLPMHLIICAHGDENGIDFGHYGDPDINALLKDESLPAGPINEQAKVSDRIIVNTMCVGGVSSMAEAFMKNGAHTYIGAMGYVDYASGTLFTVIFFDGLWRKGLSPRAAWERAVVYDDETRHFACYDADGCHRV